MAVEAYILSGSRFGGRELPESYVVTLYDTDGDRPAGSMTANHTVRPGQTGELAFAGRRGKESWEVTIGDIEVLNVSAVGFEFAVRGPISRQPVVAANEAPISQ